jgi:2-polyprenyl-3-methyl-5-hydroxy-6-metoxy-1,4-benzoquinol methylase
MSESKSSQLTVDDVVACYRALLGRDPESPDAVAAHLHAPTMRTLLQTILVSDEFQAKVRSGEFRRMHEPPRLGCPVGLHLDVDKVDVEVSASTEQLAAMMQRTASVWRTLGATEPHWSVITDSAYKAASIESTKAAFYQSGREHVAAIGALLHRNGLDFPGNGTCLDFGCGVGRLSLALAAHCGSVIGVDVSEAHLEHARIQQQKDRCRNATFSAVTSIEGINQLPPCDMLVSLIVLQHNPPPIIHAILDRLLSRLNPQGIAVFQVPTFIAGYRFSAAEYLARPASPLMEMHPLPQRHIFQLLDRHQCDVIEVREDNMAAGLREIVSQTFLAKHV